jgi:hypothetical protein
MAMTRAIDKLIVAGSIDPDRRDPKTPIGWVLDRLELGELDDGEVVQGEARLLLRVDRFTPDAGQGDQTVVEAADPQLSLFDAEGSAAVLTVPPLPPLETFTAPEVQPVRRLSYSALALFERCPYRFYAERLGGMRPVDGAVPAPGTAIGTGMAASEIGDSVHRLLERIDLSAPEPPSLDHVLAWYPNASAAELERIGVSSRRTAPRRSRLASRLENVSSERPFAFERRRALPRRRRCAHLDGARALVADFRRTCSASSPGRRGRGRVSPPALSSTPLRASAPVPTRSKSSTSSSSDPMSS